MGEEAEMWNVLGLLKFALWPLALFVMSSGVSLIPSRAASLEISRWKDMLSMPENVFLAWVIV
jgi:hypothetical protein